MFQRKNKVTIKTFKKGHVEFNFEIKYKKIKHIYFRFKDDVLYISANSKLTENQVIESIELNLDRILSLKIKKQRLESSSYQLWGNVLSKEEFFEDKIPSEKLMHEIYINETKKMILDLEDKVNLCLHIWGLKPVEIKVKPLKTKYGSCQIVKKVITINSFLAKLDPIYLYYVLLHEYAHLLVPNHQKEFYQKLDLVMKNHKEVQKNLRKHTIMF